MQRRREGPILERRTVAYSRPGYHIAHYREAALPFFVVGARLLVLEKKPLTPIEEACLGAIGAGLGTQRDIADFLGLDANVIQSTLANVSVRELLSIIRTSPGTPPHIALTSKGRSAIEVTSTIVPDEKTVPVVYDPFLRRLVYKHRSSLFRPKEVRENGWTQIPLGTRQKPEASDIPLEQLAVLAARLPQISAKGTELLAVRRLERREMYFNPAVLLFFVKDDASEVQVAVSMEGALSLEHERALAEAGSAELLGSRLVAQSTIVTKAEPRTDEEQAALARQATIEAEIQAAAIGQGPPLDAGSANEGADAAGPQGVTESEANRRLQELTFRVVRCWQHPDLLWTALKEAQKRLVIVSPWIRDKVVNRDFLIRLEQRLKAGVEVHIGYGLADDNDRKDPISPNAKKALEGLDRAYPNFHLKYLGNTHRKLLICDDRFAVSTSFNWLSFGGDPGMPARDEQGTLNSNPAKVQMLYEDAMSLLEEGYRHPTEFKNRRHKGTNRA